MTLKHLRELTNTMKARDNQMENTKATAYDLGYLQGYLTGSFENDEYQYMTEMQQASFKRGFDAGVTAYCVIEMGEESWEINL